jgi:hypothetical protein
VSFDKIILSGGEGDREMEKYMYHVYSDINLFLYILFIFCKMIEKMELDWPVLKNLIL